MPGDRKRVRLVDVAREAGVSVGAASDALSGKNRLPESTRERVREAAERLGYRPDPLARALRTGNGRMLGLLISSIERRAEFDVYRAFWAGLVASLTSAAHRQGYSLCILPEVTAVASLHIPLAGLVVVDTDPEELEQVLSLGVPVATPLLSGDPRLGVDVALDDAQMVDLALTHLRDRGCTRPGLLWPLPPLMGADRVVGSFRRWCAESSVEPIVEQFAVDPAEVADAAERLLRRGADGVLTILPGAERLLVETEGRDERLLVVSRSVGNDPLLESLGVTSVAFSIEDAADDVVEALIGLAEGRLEAPVQVSQRYVLTERRSTR